MAFTVDGSNGLTFPDSTAMSSATALGMRNRIINGAMVIDQRNAGASVTPATNNYVLDRWVFDLSQSSKFSVQQSATAPTGFVNSCILTSLSAYTIVSGDFFLMRQNIEGLNVTDLNWGSANAKTITLSFWVRSSLTGTFGGSVRNSATDRSYVFSYVINSANTWEYKTITITGDTSGTWLTTNGTGINLSFSIGTGSTYSAASGAWTAGNYVAPTGQTSVVGTNGATFYITGVQFERGTQATPFEWRPYPVELEMCQRYCQTIVGSNTGAGYFASGTNNGTAQARATTSFRTTMRAAPTSTFASAASFVVQAGSSTYTPSAVGLVAASTGAMVMFATISGATSGQGAMIGDATTSANLLTLTAEL